MALTVVVIAQGEMGSGIGQRLHERGARVLTSLAGRSAASATRAAAAGMEPVSDDARLVTQADFVLSVIPPGEAVPLARRLAPVLAASAKKPVYVDGNAISPARAREVGAVIAPTGCAFVDGGIIGGPPSPGKSGARIHVSGPDAARVLALRDYGLDIRIVEGGIGAASALKCSYAALTKGTQALGIALILGAMRAGVAPALRQELAESQPALRDFLARQIPNVYRKAYRWVAEMEEIGDHLGATADPGARDIYRGMARLFEHLAEGDKIALVDEFLDAETMASYLVGVDIGGTFTDCVVIDEAGAVTTAKSPSTPDDFARGMIDAIGAASRRLGIAADALYPQIALLSHGTTVGTNAVVQKRGAKLGLITTRGHNDVIHIMRGSRGLQGRDVRQVVHFPESQKPDPIVPKHLVEGVSERVDCFGAVVVPLNEDEAEDAIRRLIDKGVAAIAVCFLWSFLYPEHERRVRDMALRMAPDLFVTCSADLVPKWGEYERTTATALNAYIGPIASGYLSNLDRRLSEKGYRHPLQITQCGGGTISVEKAMEAPLLTLDSGPVSGVTGSLYLGRAMGYPNIITTDMGGTSFDVGIISDGKPSFSFTSNVNQYEYFIPKVDIQAIGAGGGSLVRIDERTRTMRVGPESAGAVPGPVCYGRGGTVPTVTDADLVLGYIDAESFAGGQMKLDKAKAAAAIGAIAERLGMGLYDCAAGIAKIVEFQMADIIRKMTVGKGFDPRDFVLFAFGGAGPVHAGVFSRELGVAKMVVPQRETASTWCAFGAASADVLHIHEAVDIMASPFDADRLNRTLERLTREAQAQMAKDGIALDRQHFEFALDMRHKGQINEVEIVLDWSRAEGAFEDPLKESFYRHYEQLYGRGASFRGARVEIVTYRVRASAETPRPKLVAADRMNAILPAAARRPARAVYWEELRRPEQTPIYDGLVLLPGNAVPGPCIVETPDTSVVVRPGQTLTIDAYGNFEVVLATCSPLSPPGRGLG